MVGSDVLTSHRDARNRDLCRELDLDLDPDPNPWGAPVHDPVLAPVLAPVRALAHYGRDPNPEQGTEGARIDRHGWETAFSINCASEVMVFSWEIWCALACVGSPGLLTAALVDTGRRHYGTVDAVGIFQGRSCLIQRGEGSGDAGFEVEGF